MTKWIASSCDNIPIHGHLEEPENRPDAPTRAYLLDGVQGGRRECELCDECAADITLSELADILTTYGRVVGGPPSVEPVHRPRARPKKIAEAPRPGGHLIGPVRCLNRECPLIEPPTHWGIKSHYAKVHSLATTIILPERMNQCPLCERSDFKSSQGIGVHVGTFHTDAGALYGAVVKASREGDSYGVAAEVVAWLRKNGATGIEY